MGAMQKLKTAIYIMGFFALMITQAFAQQAETEGSVLSVEPHRLVIDSVEKTGTISVSNKSGETRSYDLVLVDQVMDEKGVTQRRETFDYSAKNMLKFTPKRFSIKPNERQIVRVLATRPEGLADGDYHSHLLFHEAGLNEGDLYGIAMPVVVRQGKTSGNISISGGKISGGEARRLTLTFFRTGNAEAFARLTADYIREGVAPVRILEPQGVRLYREVEKVSKDFSLTNIPQGAKGGKIAVSLTEGESEDVRPVVTHFDFE